MRGEVSLVYTKALNQASASFAGSYGVSGVAKLSAAVSAYAGFSSAASDKSVNIDSGFPDPSRPGQGSLIRSLHNAYDLSLRQVEKTSIRLHRRVVLGGLCDLVDLFAREGTSRYGMAAHEFRHNICFS